jgi:hypothetical protein
MARRHRCDSAPIGLGHFPVRSNRSGLMVLGARRCRGLHHEGLEASTSDIDATPLSNALIGRIRVSGAGLFIRIRLPDDGR